MSLVDTAEGPQLARRALAQTALFKLARWYVSVMMVFGAVWWLSTALPPGADQDSAAPLRGSVGLLPPSEMLLRVGEAGRSWIAALVQMLAALLLVLPLAGTYVRTRSRVKYDRTLVQTVIVLPVAVTAVLMMVSHSLALAFGLAGVVGAVRFRNNLDESGDTVYIFAGIVIGFAAGVHALGIAAILSMLFVALELTLWYWDLGTPTATCWHHMASSPEEPQSLTPAAGIKQPRDQILRVEVQDVRAAEVPTDMVLKANVKRHQLTGRKQTSSGGGTLEYAVRLRKQVGRDEVTRRLNESIKDTVKRVHWDLAVSDQRPPVPANGASPEGPRR